MLQSRISKTGKHKQLVRKSVDACLKVTEVAAVLGISRAKAYELVNSDGFPRIIMGKRIVVPRQAFLNWMDEHTVTQRA